MKTVQYGRFSLFPKPQKPLYQALFNVSTISVLKVETHKKSAKSHLLPCVNLTYETSPNPPPQKTRARPMKMRVLTKTNPPLKTMFKLIDFHVCTIILYKHFCEINKNMIIFVEHIYGKSFILNFERGL